MNRAAKKILHEQEARLKLQRIIMKLKGVLCSPINNLNYIFIYFYMALILFIAFS
jgi:hypothetical protein